MNTGWPQATRGDSKEMIMLDWFNTFILLAFSVVYIGILGLIILRLWQGRRDQMEA